MQGPPTPEVIEPTDRRNRFVRRPWRTTCALLAVGLLSTEVLLRLLPIAVLDFAFEARQVYRYHDRWYTDFRPGRRARLVLPNEDGGHLLDFEIEVDERGLRRAAGDDVDHPDATVVHTIGDSFTMGWGVDGDETYPAQLDRMLGPRVDVRNLGVNGFGVLGATEKSTTQFAGGRPDLVVYLATENDYEDDETARRHARRPPWLRRLLDLGDGFRRTFLVGSLPFAGRWALQLAGIEAAAIPGDDPPPHPIRILEEQLPLSSHRPDWGVSSKQALRRYLEDDLPEGASMLILTHGTGPVVRDLAAFSRSLGLEVVRLEFDPRLIIPKDGHLTAEGNRQLAEVIAEIIRPAMAER